MSAADALVARAIGLARESFITAAGPGGQNVNKDPESWGRLKVLAGSNMTAGGAIVITARRFRTQDANRTDARDRLAALLREAMTLPEKRAKTRLNRVGKTERLATKKARGSVKANRGRVRLD